MPQLSARAGDTVAISLSGLCLAHCLALPLAAAALPVLGLWAEAEWVHRAFVAVAAPVSLWTLGRPGHGSAVRPGLLLLALAGLGLLIAGAAGFPDHEAETPLTVAGGLVLASAHLLNLTRSRVRGVPGGVGAGRETGLRRRS